MNVGEIWQSNSERHKEGAGGLDWCACTGCTLFQIKLLEHCGKDEWRIAESHKRTHTSQPTEFKDKIRSLSGKLIFKDFYKVSP